MPLEAEFFSKIADYGLLGVMVFFGFRYFVGALDKKDEKIEAITQNFSEQISRLTTEFSAELGRQREYQTKLLVETERLRSVIQDQEKSNGS